ncbi:MAG: hypothetical protein ACLFP4_10295, partial [Spirochaetales bacterium]
MRAKHVAVVVILVLCALGSAVWAGGSNESSDNEGSVLVRNPLIPEVPWTMYAPSLSAEGIGSVTFEFRSVGNTEVTLAFREPSGALQDATAFYRRRGAEDEPLWYVGRPGFARLPATSIEMPEVASLDTLELRNGGQEPPFGITVRHGTGQINELPDGVQGLKRAVGLDGRIDAYPITHPIGFELPYQGVQQVVDLYLVPASLGSRTFHRFEITIDHEFFAGEIDLFETSNAAYSDKAISLLTAALGHAPEIRTTLDDVGRIDVFDGSQYASGGVHEHLLARAASNLLGRLIEHMRVVQEPVPAVRLGGELEDPPVDMPVLSIPENLVSAWYGPSRNPYVHAYLYYLYEEHEKPVLERAIAGRLAENGLSYDYYQYRQLSPSEGEKLAEAAMRYLTWGIEYSTEPGSNEPDEGQSHVYAATNCDGWEGNDADCRSYTAVRQWITGESGSTIDHPDYIDRDAYRSGNASGIFADNAGGAVVAANRYFTSPSVMLEHPQRLERRFTTPFFILSDTDGPEGITGNPLPHAVGGIDTPRTFNYKMYQNIESETDSLPFQAGTGTGVAEARARLSDKWNVAGIGNLELLSGALSMTEGHVSTAISRFEIVGIGGQKLGVIQRQYASFDRQHSSDAVVTITNENGAPRPTPIDEMPGVHGRLRMTRADIERSTFIVPNISEIRPGDLLVRFGSQEQEPRLRRFDSGDRLPYPSNAQASSPEIAIVVGMQWEDLDKSDQTPTKESDPRDHWHKVYVLTSSAQFEQVVLATWGDTQTARTSFSAQPEAFHIRRLLASPSNKNAGNTAWDPFSLDPVSLRMSIQWQADSYEDSHGRDVEQRWISNVQLADGSYEVLEASYIGVEGLTNTSAKTSLHATLGDRVPVRFLAPADVHARDPANRPANEGYSHNIFENQGGGLEIVVQDTQGRWQAIARFERESNPEQFATPYREVSLAGGSTGAAWHQSLHRQRGRGLYVVGNELVYRIGGGSDVQLTTFGVRLPS